MSKVRVDSPQDDPNVDEQDSTEMPILAHLGELRVRVTWAFGGLLVGAIAALLFTKPLFEFLTSCNFSSVLLDSSAINNACGQIQAISPTEPLQNYFRIAFVSGAALAMPWILFQLWLFIAPGLHRQEKRYVYIFVPFATLLFVAGVLFAWFILLPPAISFLNTFLSDSLEIQWTVDNYIDFVTGFLFWLGVAFEMPLVFYFLARFGIVSSAFLREQWRFAIVGIAILAAVITPSIDPVTMLLTMVPLTILYIFSIALAAIGQRQFLR